MSGDTDDEAVTEFEADLAALEATVQALQRGSGSLEEAIRAFEEGIARYRKCSAALRTAELRVARLVEGVDGLREAPLASEG